MIARLLAGLWPALAMAAPGIDLVTRFELTRGFVTADPQGNIVITGHSPDCSLPVVNPISTCGWIWVGKLDPTGRTLLFGTYLGERGTDAQVVVVRADGEGNIVVVSSVTQGPLPAVNAIQPQGNGSYDVHIFKLAADGSRLIYATYLGGRGFDNPESMALDGTGAAYILVSSTGSPDFPPTPGPVTSTANTRSVVAKLSADGRTLEYAASFAREDFDTRTLAVDRAGSALVISPREVVRLAPDGGGLQRWALPDWTREKYPYSRLTPAEAGGFWLYGTTDRALPVTPDAFEQAPVRLPYLRVENGESAGPATPIEAGEVREFAVDPQERKRVYAATDGGVFKSEDNGWNWARLLADPSRSVAVDPFDGKVLYATSDKGFYRSTDRGENWTLLRGGLSGGIAVDANVPGLIYVGNFRSEDRGDTMLSINVPQPPRSPIGCGSGCLFTNALRAWVDPAQARRVYVLTETRCIGFCPVVGALLRSSDGGATFDGATGTGISKDSPSVAIDAATGDLFLVDMGKAKVYRGSLNAQELLDVPEALAVVVDPLHPGTVYLSLANGGIMRSEDRGRTWNLLTTLPAPASRIAVADGGVVHASQPASFSTAYGFHYDASNNLVYGTHFGRCCTGAGVAVQTANGHFFLGGSTGPGLPVANAFQPDYAGGGDAYLAEFDRDGALLNSTYLGGSGSEQISSLVALEDGSVVAIGTSSSGEFLSKFEASVLGEGSWFVVRVPPVY